MPTSYIDIHANTSTPYHEEPPKAAWRTPTIIVGNTTLIPFTVPETDVPKPVNVEALLTVPTKREITARLAAGLSNAIEQWTDTTTDGPTEETINGTPFMDTQMGQNNMSLLDELERQLLQSNTHPIDTLMKLRTYIEQATLLAFTSGSPTTLPTPEIYSYYCQLRAKFTLASTCSCPPLRTYTCAACTRAHAELTTYRCVVKTRKTYDHGNRQPTINIITTMLDSMGPTLGAAMFVDFHQFIISGHLNAIDITGEGFSSEEDSGSDA